MIPHARQKTCALISIHGHALLCLRSSHSMQLLIVLPYLALHLHLCYSISMIRSLVEHITRRVLPSNKGELRPVPDFVLGLVFFLCMSVLLQGIADIAIKVVSMYDMLPYIPLRTAFLFLTAVSVLMGYRTLEGMRNRHFDVTRNSIELGFLVEVGLIVADLEFIALHLHSVPNILWIRIPFVILTFINLCILLYTYWVLELHQSRLRGGILRKAGLSS